MRHSRFAVVWPRERWWVVWVLAVVALLTGLAPVFGAPPQAPPVYVPPQAPPVAAPEPETPLVYGYLSPSGVLTWHYGVPPAHLPRVSYEQFAAPGVAAAPRPFPGGGSTARTTPATPAPFAGTNPPPTNGGTPPRTTAPTASKAATPTAPTITSARGAAPAASSLAGSIEIGSGKTIASDWYDDQGNHFIRYTDGSTKICSAYG